MWSDSTECNRQWEWFDRNNNRRLTSGSLHYWARKDNSGENNAYDKYQAIHKNTIDFHIYQSILENLASSPIANAINLIFDDLL